MAERGDEHPLCHTAGGVQIFESAEISGEYDVASVNDASREVTTY